MSHVMASLSVAAAVPAALQSNVETSLRSCPSSTRVLMASRKSTAVSLRRCVAARASASEKVIEDAGHPENVGTACACSSKTWISGQAVDWSSEGAQRVPSGLRDEYH